MTSADKFTPAAHPPRHSLRTYLILLTFIALRAFGNLALAWGTKHFSESLSFNPFGYLRAMLNPYVAAGILMLMLSLLTRLALLSVADLSFILPMTAIGYVFSVVLGKVFLHEEVSPVRWLGALLIFGAIVLVGSTPQNTTPRNSLDSGSPGNPDTSFNSLN